jgi:hypothetical protein
MLAMSRIRVFMSFANWVGNERAYKNEWFIYAVSHLSSRTETL